MGWLLARLLPWRLRGSGSEHQGPRPLPPSQVLDWIDAAPQGWLVLDPLTTIQYVNPRARRLLQQPSDRLRRGVPLADAMEIPELLEVVLDARRLGRPQRVDWMKGGEPLEAHALPGQDGWVGVLLQSRRSLEAQLEQQERWVSDVAHELRTPLTALRLVGDSLAGQLEGRNGVLVQRLQRELDRLQLLVNDLLELSRLENTLHREGGRYTSLDLSELVTAAWASLAPLAERREISLQLSAPAAAALRGDGSRLHRALLNLLDNALRHSPDAAAVEVSVQPSGNWWLLSVRDHGGGLSEEDERRMFERFYRGDPSRERSQRGGSGLGLAIVQQIAVTHGGRVQGRNHAEGGAVMDLLLPRGG
ncbi:HAMP domain-containing histidine kinase [Cyanobium sp. Morenito 9A2]|nr:HAMP domain-containing histidine kinase [Cyanobium sp. Morenito 9A2]